MNAKEMFEKLDYHKEEIWKDIDGCKGIYQVSNLGRFKWKYENE